MRPADKVATISQNRTAIHVKISPHESKLKCSPRPKGGKVKLTIHHLYADMMNL